MRTKQFVYTCLLIQIIISIFCVHCLAAKAIEEYNDEEFVGFEQLQKTASDEEVIKRINAEQLPALPPPRTNFYLEYFYGGLIMVYLLNFFIGRYKNEAIAKSWLSSVIQEFEANFTKVGMPAGPGSSLFANRLIKESQAVFKLKATGRINCVGVQATLQLRKRQDFVSCYIMETIFGTVDTLLVDVLLEESTMDSFVFACLKKKEEKKYRKATPDIAQFTKNAQSVEGLNSAFVVVSEVDELVNRFMPQSVVATLNKPLLNEFVRMHFTDQGIVSPNYPRSLQFEFKLTSDAEKLASMMKLVFFLIDRVATMQLSKPAKQVTDKHRQKVEEAIQKEKVAQRQEAIQQKKIDKVREEKEKLDKLSPEEQRRMEEKMAKKDAKKKIPKMKVLYG